MLSRVSSRLDEDEANVVAAGDGLASHYKGRLRLVIANYILSLYLQ